MKLGVVVQVKLQEMWRNFYVHHAIYLRKLKIKLKKHKNF
jgi:hypothetical protein